MSVSEVNEVSPKLQMIMSVVMTIVWAMMFTTGDDDLFWTWVITSFAWVTIFRSKKE